MCIAISFVAVSIAIKKTCTKTPAYHTFLQYFVGRISVTITCINLLIIRRNILFRKHDKKCGPINQIFFSQIFILLLLGIKLYIVK
jgi:hypothetical protein